MNSGDEMKRVFDYALTKKMDRDRKPLNTTTPWKDFSIEWLDLRLDDEIAEYKQSRKLSELLDIINIATFIFIARENQLGRELERKEEGE